MPVGQSTLMKIVLGHSGGTVKREKSRPESTLGLDLSGLFLFSVIAIGKLPVATELYSVCDALDL